MSISVDLGWVIGKFMGSKGRSVATLSSVSVSRFRFSFHKFFRRRKIYISREYGNSNEESHKTEVEGHMELRRHVNKEEGANVDRMKKKEKRSVASSGIKKQKWELLEWILFRQHEKE